MPTLRSLDTEVQVEPLRQWPTGYDRTPPGERKGSPFEANEILDRTLKDLGHELRQLEARNVVLQVEIPEGMIRVADGLPYKRADVDPGVVLTLENENGLQTYPCDTFPEWTHNLRAIVLALRALRRVSRYGVGRGSEQYRGYTALVSDVDTRMTSDDAARLLCRTAPGEWRGLEIDEAVADVLSDPGTFRRVYRAAAKASHPDQVGNDAHFKRVQVARSLLDHHHRERGAA